MPDIILWSVPSDTDFDDHRLRDPSEIEVGGFPAQFFGLKAFFQSAIWDLCLVAAGDAPSGMGGKLFISKNGTTYGVFLVETGDAQASPIYIRTTTGTKAIRKKT